MADGSDLFKDYESDFKQLLTSINEKINSGIASKSGGKCYFQAAQYVSHISESRKTTIREAERYIDEGDEILGQMEMEVLNFSQSTKTKCQARIRTHRADLEKVKKELVGSSILKCSCSSSETCVTKDNIRSRRSSWHR